MRCICFVAKMLTNSMKSASQAKPISDYNARRIIVAAASARSIAASSLRAGRPVSTIDLFSDADTAAICGQSNRHLLTNQTQNFSVRCENMEQIAQRVEEVLGDRDFQDQFGPPTILVGGGLENYFRNHTRSRELIPQTRDHVSCETACWRHVSEFCRRNSIRYPSTTREVTAHQAKQRWLVKTDFSSGGLGVQFAQTNTSLKPDQYFQKYIEGQSISACYVAAPVVEGDEFSFVELLGVCEPVSTSAINAHGRASGEPFPFRYAGSIGPIHPSRLAEATLAEFKRVGSLVANHSGVAGIFGVDFVLEQDNLWLLEINPRITASAELIENAAREAMADFSIVQLHLDALSGNVDRASALIGACQNANARDRIFAKKIVYRHHEATQALRLTRFQFGALENQFGGFAESAEWPLTSGTACITDIPKPETNIVAGHPVLTIHVSGESQIETEEALAREFEVVEKILGERLS